MCSLVETPDADKALPCGAEVKPEADGTVDVMSDGRRSAVGRLSGRPGGAPRRPEPHGRERVKFWPSDSYGMERSVFIRSDDVELCPVETDDAAFLARLVNDPAVRRGIGTTTPTPLHDEREWIEDGAGTHLLVVAADEPVGIVGFEETEPSWGVVELGYFFDPGAWGNGHATTAATLAVDHAFRERRYAKVVASVYETNPASARVLEKVGFEREATLRAEAFIEGDRVDVHRYGLLAAEYEPETTR